MAAMHTSVAHVAMAAGQERRSFRINRRSHRGNSGQGWGSLQVTTPRKQCAGDAEDTAFSHSMASLQMHGLGRDGATQYAAAAG